MKVLQHVSGHLGANISQLRAAEVSKDAAKTSRLLSTFGAVVMESYVRNADRAESEAFHEAAPHFELFSVAI
ncbi:hypothetical protein EVAR_27936_1 [Eumeta japonica]|uniref:Uncharacterized protein n=1 Tax=Eumeta variegata TaxID=151549 RepID=A0A4C1UWF6_EUMVA|nr:hypothetical protein EVAR_27936_1 [Eumeta japonica]